MQRGTNRTVGRRFGLGSCQGAGCKRSTAVYIRSVSGSSEKNGGTYVVPSTVRSDIGLDEFSHVLYSHPFVDTRGRNHTVPISSLPQEHCNAAVTHVRSQAAAIRKTTSEYLKGELLRGEQLANGDPQW